MRQLFYIHRFFTPEVVVANENIEFLILVKKNASLIELGFQEELKEEDVNTHLKICSKFEAEKIFVGNPLFLSGNLDEKIKIEKTGAYETGRFRGILDLRVVELFKKNGYEVLYKASISKDCLKQSSEENQFYKIKEDQRKIEDQDKIIEDVLQEMNSKNLPKEGQFAFKILNKGDGSVYFLMMGRRYATGSEGSP